MSLLELYTIDQAFVTDQRQLAEHATPENEANREGLIATAFFAEMQALTWDGPYLKKTEDDLFSLEPADQHSLYARISGELYHSFSLLQRSLKLSSNSDTSAAARLALTPKATGVETCNGAYFVSLPQRSRGSSLSPGNTVEFHRKFVIKPTAQEGGTPGNPAGHLKKIKYGIEGGEGAIRERLAYVSQKKLGMDLGVPPTGIIETQHLVLSAEYGTLINCARLVMRTLEQKFTIEINLDIPSILNKSEHPMSLGELAEIVVGQIVDKDQSGLLATVAKAAELTVENGKSLRTASLLQNFKKTGGDVSEFRSNQTMVLRFAQLASLQSKKATGGICSAQTFVPGCLSLHEMNADEKKDIPTEEVQKLVLDLVLYNTDRNNGNVLYHPPTQKVVLIDHGMCLPNAHSGLEDNAVLEWVHLEQTNTPLKGEFADAISQLNIDQFVKEIKQDMEEHVQAYGEQCHVHESAFLLLELNLRMIKMGIASGATLKTMALMQHPLNLNGHLVGGDHQQIYDKYILPCARDNRLADINWIQIENELKCSLETINLEVNNYHD